MISVNICYTGSVDINAQCNAIVLFVHFHCSDYSSTCTRKVINIAFPASRAYVSFMAKVSPFVNQLSCFKKPYTDITVFGCTRCILFSLSISSCLDAVLRIFFFCPYIGLSIYISWIVQSNDTMFSTYNLHGPGLLVAGGQLLADGFLCSEMPRLMEPQGSILQNKFVITVYFKSYTTSPLPLVNIRKDKVIGADRLAN